MVGRLDHLDGYVLLLALLIKLGSFDIAMHKLQDGIGVSLQ